MTIKLIEYFKNHPEARKCIVDPELVKGSRVDVGGMAGMQKYSPVVFQTRGNVKKEDQAGEKLDFPSTGKFLDLTDPHWRDFPSTAETGQPIAAAFGNPHAGSGATPSGQGNILPGDPHADGGERSWNGPDTQRKGSDYPDKRVPTRKSLTLAGRRVRLVKGDEGSRNGNLGGYPIDATEEAEKRKAFLRDEAMKEKVAEHKRVKEGDSGRTLLNLATSPDAYLGRARDSKPIGEYTKEYPGAKVTFNQPIDPNKPKKKVFVHLTEQGRDVKIKREGVDKSIGRIILQYTQNQPLAAAFKPLIGYLVRDDKDYNDEKDDKKPIDKAMSTEEVYAKIRSTSKKEPRLKPIKKPDLGPDALPEDYQSHDPDYSSWASKENAKWKSERSNPITEKSKTETSAEHEESLHRRRWGLKAEKSHSNPIDGGVGDELDYKDVDQQELAAGINVEQEHVGKDSNIDDDEKKVKAADIAMDHLKEDDTYYTKLAEMERTSKAEAKSNTQKEKLLKLANKSKVTILPDGSAFFTSIVGKKKNKLADVGKSIPRQKKLENVVAGSEKMVKIREETNASPAEMKTTVGQLKAYTAKLKAERKKNVNLLRASHD